MVKQSYRWGNTLKSRSNSDRTTECECGNIAWKMEKNNGRKSVIRKAA